MSENVQISQHVTLPQNKSVGRLPQGIACSRQRRQLVAAHSTATRHNANTLVHIRAQRFHPASMPKKCVGDDDAVPAAEIVFSAQEIRYVQKCYGRTETRKLRRAIRQITSSAEPQRLRVLRSKLPTRIKNLLFNQLRGADGDKYHMWAEAALKIPLQKFSPVPEIDDRAFLQQANYLMEECVTGQAEAKSEVLRLICTWLRTGTSTGFALGLEGEAGVGKTTFVKEALRKALGRPCSVIALGGMSDASTLTGHGFTYENATMGALAECLSTAGVSDPVILFDELDKVSCSAKGEEIINTLVHITDPCQNDKIRDKYLQFDLDLSRAIIVFSYNDPTRISPILLDRLKRVRFEKPTVAEKIEIVSKHLVPRTMQAIQLDEEFPESVISTIVKRHSHEPGLRSIAKDVLHVIQSYILATTLASTRALGFDSESIALNDEFAARVLPQQHERAAPTLMYS